MRKYSNWIQAYVQHTRFSESPDAFHFWTGVATVAGALRRRVWRNEFIFQWTPNFYIVLVGPPGVAAKSTSVRLGVGLLEKVPGIHFGPQSMTWQALTQSLESALEGVEINGEMEQMSCLTCAVSELGTFLKPDDDGLISTLVAMWDGQKETWGHKTKTQGETIIKNPWLNIIACTTPGWLNSNFPPVMIEGGLTSRIIFVYGDTKRQLVAYPSQLTVSSTYYKEEENLIHDLIEISEMKGEYEIAPDALVWGEEWYRELHRARGLHMASERFAGYLARKQGHLHKLAMVLAASKRDELVITVDDLRESNLFLEDVEQDMGKVFSSVGQSNGARVSNEVLGFIRNHKEITNQNLWRLCCNNVSHTDYIDSIKGLLEAGYIRLSQKGNEKIITYVKKEL